MPSDLLTAGSLDDMELAHDEGRPVVEWVALVLGTAAASMLAFLLTQARCGVASIGPPVSTSAYCLALGAPGTSAHLLGIVLLVVLFVAPATAMLAGALMPGGRSSRAVRRLAFGAIGVVGVSFMLLLAAHASYQAD